MTSALKPFKGHLRLALFFWTFLAVEPLNFFTPSFLLPFLSLLRGLLSS